MNKPKPEVEVAVLLLFFTRTDITARTFEQIRKARPARLYLYQDGPRQGREDDIINIKECRERIESMIDWDCEVHRNYQEKNYGCDPSEYISQKWMFSYETKGIIIEDDDVMSVSFFRFCKELLDKYENDTRINIICGMNHLGVYKNCPYDYFFSRRGGAIWGWATWKRNIDKWDSQYEFLKDKYALHCLEAEFGVQPMANYRALCKKHYKTGREHYESILGSFAFTNNTLNIVPTKNMTCNCGVGMETTHSDEYHKLPLNTRKQLFMKTYELEFPLKHPKYVQNDCAYWELMQRSIRGSKLYRIFQIGRIEHILYSMFPKLGKWVIRFEKNKQF